VFLTKDELYLLPLVVGMSHHERRVRRAMMTHFASHFTEEGIAEQVLRYAVALMKQACNQQCLTMLVTYKPALLSREYLVV
jgi:hypothetical protein